MPCLSWEELFCVLLCASCNFTKLRFAGVGGLERGIIEYVHTLLFVEKNPDCLRVLQQRMNDRQLPSAATHPDVCTVRRSHVPGGVADMITGGFPCQDISQAGKRLGVAKGKRSGS